MAADSGRSPAPSAESYIGSLISLTSKSEIRYEGILFNINTEESSIGLQNVRSFGTEGRKKDGPQVPASEKIYEYILFRGSDIKDLQVKSSPPAQPPSIHNDPAIIQSHYSQPASTSVSLPSTGSSTIADPATNVTQMGLPRPTFQGGLPLYQPGPNLVSWGPQQAPPSANGSGLAMPMYWPGFYAPSAGLPHLQQSSLLRPPPGMPMAQSIQQPLQYPGINSSLQSGSSNLPEFPPLFPLTSSTQNLTSTTLTSTVAPVQASLLAPEASALAPTKPTGTSLPATASSLIPNMSHVTSTPATVSSLLPSMYPVASVTSTASVANLPLASPLTSSHGLLVSRSEINSSTVSNRPMTTPILGGQPQATSSLAGLSTSKPVEPAVSLVTPDQLLQPGPSTTPPSQPLQTNNKDEVVTQETKKKSPILDSAARAPALVKEPILPLPKPTYQRTNGSIMHTHHYNRGRGRGSGRGRANGHSRPVTKFTEEFDFTAMNEKFNKDEVWGHLGKSKALDKEGGDNDDESDDNLEEDDAETDKPEVKPVYVKDDFFDSLSSNALDRESRGRMKFSEQRKLDTETFGEFPKHRVNRGGGRGFRGVGRARGSYHGRGYGYAPRGRGHACRN